MTTTSTVTKLNTSSSNGRGNINTTTTTNQPTIMKTKTTNYLNDDLNKKFQNININQQYYDRQHQQNYFNYPQQQQPQQLNITNTTNSTATLVPSTIQIQNGTTTAPTNTTVNGNPQLMVNYYPTAAATANYYYQTTAPTQQINPNHQPTIIAAVSGTVPLQTTSNTNVYANAGHQFDPYMYCKYKINE